MAFGSLTATSDMYSWEISSLQNEITDLTMDRQMALRSASELADTTQTSKELVRATCEAGTDEYEEQMDEINDQYSAALADIQAWESELDTQISSDELQLQALNAEQKSMDSVRKENVEKDLSFGGS